MSETYKILILSEAQQDIRNIVLYIARKLLAPQAALHLERAFRKEILSLAHMPSRFSTIDEQPWKDAGIRKSTVKNYYIYYLIDRRCGKNGQSHRGDLCWPGSGKAIVETKQTKRNESAIIQTKSTLKTTNI